MATKIWVATYVDQSDTCDGKARTLGVYKTKAEAVRNVKADIEKWTNDMTSRAGEGVRIDFDKMSAVHLYCDEGCEWNIEEVAMT